LVTWIIVALGALSLDILTANFFFSCFTIGGLAALIASILGQSVQNQIIIFIVVSVASLMTAYPLIRKYLKKSVPRTPTTEEGYVGSVITAEVDVRDTARMKIGGIYWSVVNAGEPILIGEKMKIVDIQGNKFVVKKIEEEN